MLDDTSDFHDEYHNTNRSVLVYADFCQMINGFHETIDLTLGTALGLYNAITQ
jgi:hypothetical protein